VLDLIETWIFRFVEKCFRANDETGNAVAALTCIAVGEGLLNGAEVVVFCEAFNGRDFGPDRIYRKHHAAVD